MNLKKNRKMNYMKGKDAIRVLRMYMQWVASKLNGAYSTKEEIETYENLKIAVKEELEMCKKAIKNGKTFEAYLI